MRRPQSYIKNRKARAIRRGWVTAPPAPPPSCPISARQREYRASLTYGHGLEEQAILAFSTGTTPEWFSGVRPASEAEDQAGIDLWVGVNGGEVAVQVKASAALALRFRQEHPGMEVATVVLHARMDDEETRTRILDAVWRVMVSRMRRAA